MRRGRLIPKPGASVYGASKANRDQPAWEAGRRGVEESSRKDQGEGIMCGRYELLDGQRVFIRFRVSNSLLPVPDNLDV